MFRGAYSVLVVQEPETSLAADVAATRRVLDKTGPCVLVGHSYGGMIITEAGMHPDTNALERADGDFFSELWIDGELERGLGA